MTKVLFLYALCLTLAYLSHASSKYSLSEARYITKERYFYHLLVLSVIIFAGTRTNYNDTWNYISAYNQLDVSGGLFDISWSIGDHPFYMLTIRCMKLLGFSAQSYIMAFTAFIMGVYLWFIRKYSNHIIWSVFLFFTMGCFGFAMAALKQCAATAFSLIGVHKLLQKRKASFVLWVLSGALFHPFAVMYLICPFLMYRPWTGAFYLVMGATAVAGFFMQTWLGGVIDLLSVVGVEYDTAELTKESVNIFRVLVLWAPIVLSRLVFEQIYHTGNKQQYLFLNLSCMAAELMFIALFGNPIYFGRLANYFLIFQTISLPFVLSLLPRHDRKTISHLAIVGYSAYCLYGNLFAGRSFDNSFLRSTLWQYIFS